MPIISDFWEIYGDNVNLNIVFFNLMKWRNWLKLIKDTV